MPETVQIILRYEGSDVSNGTMTIADVIVALQGFSGAYSKIASASDPNGQHQIRVSDINKSSFSVVILAWVADNKEAITSISSAAVGIVGLIIKLIDSKKKNKGREPDVQISGDHNIVLMGEGNTQTVITKEMYELIKSKTLDSELAKIVRPLEEHKIERAQLTAIDSLTGTTETAEILVADKPYFQAEESTTVVSKSAQLTGNLISLNKESNRGIFRMQNVKSVKYHLVGPEPERMYGGFAHMGMVTIECIASFDEDLEVRSLDVTSITPLQRIIDFDQVATREIQH